MEAGDLQHQLVLKRRVATKDATGGEVITYPPVGAVAANVNPVRGRQYEALSMAQSDAEIIVTIYYREDIQHDWRVEWRGQDYDITEPPKDVGARKIWLELMCQTAQE